MYKMVETTHAPPLPCASMTAPAVPDMMPSPSGTDSPLRPSQQCPPLVTPLSGPYPSRADTKLGTRHNLDLVDEALLLQGLLLAVGPEVRVVREEFEVLVVLDLLTSVGDSPPYDRGPWQVSMSEVSVWIMGCHRDVRGHKHPIRLGRIASCPSRSPP